MPLLPLQERTVTEQEPPVTVLGARGTQSIIAAPEGMMTVSWLREAGGETGTKEENRIELILQL